MEVANLKAKLSVDTREFTQGIDKAERALKGLDDTTVDTGRSVGGMGGAWKGAALAMGVFATGAIATKTIQFLSSAVNAASDLGESINAVEKVFGTASATITQFGEGSAQAVGMATAEFNSLATVTGALLQNFGFSASAAADETINLTERAADLASVFNTDVSDAMGAINAALRGETEPIRRYAIDVSNATLAQYALSQGITESVDAMSMQEKVALRVGAIMEQSEKAAGDFKDTQDGFANATRTLAAEWTNAQAAIGEAIIPIVETMLPGLISGVQGVSDTVLKLRKDFIALRSIMDFLPGISDTQYADELMAVVDAQLLVSRATREGVERTEALDEAMAGLYNQFGVNNVVMDEFSDMLNVTDQEMYNLYRSLVAVAGTDADVRELTVAFGPYIDSVLTAARDTDEMGNAAKRMIAEAENMPELLGDVGDAAGDAADGIDDATEALVKWQDVIRANADPVFAAIKAMETYTKAVETASAPEATQTDQLAVVEAWLDAGAAFEALDTDHVNAAIIATAQALDVPIEAARTLLVELGLLDGQVFEFTVNGTLNLPPMPKGFVDGGVEKGGRLMFQSGGMVPGPLGAPRLAVVHGGEEVLTAQQRAERNVTVNMNGNVTSGGMMGDEIALALLMAGVNEQAEFRGLADVRG